MTQRVYLVTEGVHDVAYVSRILVKVEDFGFTQAETLDKLDDEWRRWVESSFKWPHKGRIDRASVPAPEFYVRPDMAVAVVNAEGIAGIRGRLDVDLEAFALSGIELDAVGVVLDADTDSGEHLNERFEQMAARLAELGLPRPRSIGEVAGKPRTGVFILPDGARPGTLEDVLIPLGKAVYGGLFVPAERFVEEASKGLHALRAKERNEVNKPAGRKKALLSAVAAILKPGKAIQATLRDHRWISPETLQTTEVKPTIDFLERLLSTSRDPGISITS